LLRVKVYFSSPPIPVRFVKSLKINSSTGLIQFFSQLARAGAGTYKSGGLMPQTTAVSKLQLRTGLRLFRVYERFMPRLEN
jgi:hypothetical protein